MYRFLRLNLQKKKDVFCFIITLQTLLEPFCGSGFLLQTHVFAENSEIDAVFTEGMVCEDNVCELEADGEDSMDTGDEGEDVNTQRAAGDESEDANTQRAAGDDGEDANTQRAAGDEGGDKEMSPNESASCAHCQTNAVPLVLAATHVFDVGMHTLQSFVSAHGAMRLKDKWDTSMMVPVKMHIALASNLDARVDWRLLVFWVAFLEFYQDQTNADAIENEENEANEIQNKQKNEQCLREAKKAKKDDIVEEKAAVYAKHKADKAASAAVAALIEIQNKLEFQRQKLATSKKEYKTATTEKRKIAANNMLQKHKDMLNQLIELELQKNNTNVEAMATAARTAETLERIQTKQNSTSDDACHVEIDATLPESVEKIEICAKTLSTTLEEYWDRIRLENPERRSPTLEELDEQ